MNKRFAVKENHNNTSYVAEQVWPFDVPCHNVLNARTFLLPYQLLLWNACCIVVRNAWKPPVRAKKRTKNVSYDRRGKTSIFPSDVFVTTQCPHEGDKRQPLQSTEAKVSACNNACNPQQGGPPTHPPTYPASARPHVVMQGEDNILGLLQKTRQIKNACLFSERKKSVSIHVKHRQM